MSQKLRFKCKTYGWGWTPASWQGRAVTILYILLTITRLVSYKIMSQKDREQRKGTPSEVDAGGNLLVALLPLVILTIALLIISYHTGEKPKRQRGKQKE